MTGDSEIDEGLTSGETEVDGGDTIVAGGGGVAGEVFDGDGADTVGGGESGVGVDGGDFFGDGVGDCVGDCAVTEQINNAATIKKRQRERAIVIK
ncbi:hypothetical protein V6N12_012176 [Hibiscus sabdariffa]|uniref:Uncharacterized protein n=1 Tax=Hibiscus sabdariffa TaxID=183260 RepID=A0ABR2CHP4_9ROSI